MPLHQDTWCDRCFDPIVKGEPRSTRITNGREYVICMTCERKEREQATPISSPNKGRKVENNGL